MCAWKFTVCGVALTRSNALQGTYHKDWKNMTLMEYATNHGERDWMVRMLVGKYAEELDESDLDFAKHFVSSRMWIGLTSEMEESIDRFGAIYGWNQKPKWDSCVNRYTGSHGSNKHKHPKIDHDSTEWKRLSADNHYDVQLYLHAVDVFEAQTAYFDVSNET